MDRIEQALLDPQWGWGTVIIDGVTLYHLTLLHPVHGKISSVISKTTANQIINGLAELIGEKKN